MNNLVILKNACQVRGKLLQSSLQAGVRNFSLSKTLGKDHYEVLGIKSDASQAEIKNAYFELSKIYHPDRIAGTDENIAKFREITTAYEILGNETSRRLYDKGLIREKRGGIDEPEDSKDPIIQFYKQRQMRSQIPTVGKSVEEMEAWTQEFYKSIRQATVAKHELFTARKKKIKVEENSLEYLSLVIVAGLVFVFVIQSNMQNHPIRLLLTKTLSSEDCDA